MTMITKTPITPITNPKDVVVGTMTSGTAIATKYNDRASHLKEPSSVFSQPFAVSLVSVVLAMCEHRQKRPTGVEIQTKDNKS